METPALYEADEVERAISEWAINFPPCRPTSSPPGISPARIGEDLKEIRDRRLYRAHFQNFYVYCARRFGLKPNRVNAFIAAAEGRAPEPMPSAESDESAPRYVYFIYGAGLIKIGVADDVRKRFAAIRTMSPVPLVLLGYVDGDAVTEAALHRRFAHQRRHGEWFAPSAELETFIQENTQHA